MPRTKIIRQRRIRCTITEKHQGTVRTRTVTITEPVFWLHKDRGDDIKALAILDYDDVEPE